MSILSLAVTGSLPLNAKSMGLVAIDAWINTPVSAKRFKARLPPMAFVIEGIRNIVVEKIKLFARPNHLARLLVTAPNQLKQVSCSLNSPTSKEHLCLAKTYGDQ